MTIFQPPANPYWLSRFEEASGLADYDIFVDEFIEQENENTKRKTE